MNYSRSQSFGAPSVTPAVKALAIINIVVWFFLILIVQQFFLKADYSVFKFFGFVPGFVNQYGMVWQFFTYMFLHASGIFHILFNLLILWMFGSELERLWGSKFFTIYYLFCGVGAAVIYYTVIMLLSFFSIMNTEALMGTPVVGSSGAIFGLMLAYGWLFKDRVVYVMMIFPMKARTFAILIVAIELVSVLGSKLAGPVANLAHIGGIISGALFLIFWTKWSRIRTYFQRRPFKSLKLVRPGERSSSQGKTWN